MSSRTPGRRSRARAGRACEWPPPRSPSGPVPVDASIACSSGALRRKRFPKRRPVDRTATWIPQRLPPSQAGFRAGGPGRHHGDPSAAARHARFPSVDQLGPDVVGRPQEGDPGTVRDLNRPLQQAGAEPFEPGDVRLEALRVEAEVLEPMVRPGVAGTERLARARPRDVHHHAAVFALTADEAIAEDAHLVAQDLEGEGPRVPLGRLPRIRRLQVDVVDPIGHGVSSDQSSNKPSARATRSAVMGRRVTRTPAASAMALATAAAGGPMGGSPMPRALKGPSPSPDSTTTASTSGTSAAVGIRYVAKDVVRLIPSSTMTSSMSP